MNSKDINQVFEDAIASGHFSINENSSNYVGHYMYMGSDDNKDYFKHQMTRAYSNRVVV